MVELYIIYNVYSFFELMHTQLLRLALCFLTLVMLSACGGKDDPIINPDIPAANEQPVCFSSSLKEGEELVTRAQDAPSCTRASADFFYTRANTPLNQNFIVYGYKTLSESNQPIVFPGYNVTYTANSAGSSEDNTHNYSYVDPSRNQFVKYWDYSATEYRYWGYVENNSKVTVNSNGTALSINGLSVGITEPINYLVSALKVVPKTEYNQVVQLRFLHPYAKVRVMIYAGEQLETGDAIELSKVSFGPSDPSIKIVKSATVKVTYPLTNAEVESYSIENSPALTYFSKFEYQGFDQPSTGAEKVIKLTSSNCASNTAAIAYPKEAQEASKDTQTFYYVLPTGTGVDATDYKFEVSVDGDDELKSAIVPSVYMHWKPNYQYTYIFKILEGGLLFIDAQVEEWKSGGEAVDTWPNW